MHSKEFSENQEKRQNFDPSILPYTFGLIFMGMKHKKYYRENQSKFIWKNGWVEILMFSLVFRKFLAMYNNTLYSECTLSQWVQITWEH